MVEEKEITVNIKKYDGKNDPYWKTYKVRADRYTQMTEVLRRIKLSRILHLHTGPRAIWQCVGAVP